MKSLINEELIISILSKDSTIEGAILHGSAEKGTMRISSDVDIAILLTRNTKISGFALAKLSTTLSFAMSRFADVGILSSKNLVYAHEAIFNGRRIFVRNKFFFDLTVATLLGMYAQFNEDRKEVLCAYTA